MITIILLPLVLQPYHHFFQFIPLFRQLTPFSLPVVINICSIACKEFLQYFKSIIMKIFLIVCSGIFFLQGKAQTIDPKGYKKGAIVFADSSSMQGFVKDNIRRSASIIFIRADGQKKMNYHGSELISVEIESTKFICIRGDFFRILSEGELLLLQKSSDASGIPTYNGSEAIFTSGTEGKLLDY